VRRHHHHFVWRAIEGITGRAIDLQLGLVVARMLGTEDRVPVPAVAARQRGHQRDVAVGAGREQELGAQAGERGRHVRPGVEAVPSERELAPRTLVRVVPEVVEHDVQVASVQHLELAKRDTASAHLFHRRLVLGAPGIGQRAGFVGAHMQMAPQLARHAAAPIDERAEDVEDERTHPLHAQRPWALRQASNAALLLSSVGGYSPRIE
jgi:hypothetical protein